MATPAQSPRIPKLRSPARALFDAHRYNDAFMMVALTPLVGALIWWLLPSRARPDQRE